MITREQWEQLKQEFKEQAFKRLKFKQRDNWCEINNESAERWVNNYPSYVELKSLPELLEHDVKFYKENAHLMWKYKVKGMDGSQTMPLPSNFHIEFFGLEQYDLVRKDSAGLEFDLQRAIVHGDKVEILEYINKGRGIIWKDFDIGTDYYVRNDGGLGTIPLSHLRMKYPPRATND